MEAPELSTQPVPKTTAPVVNNPLAYGFKRFDRRRQKFGKGNS